MNRTFAGILWMATFAFAALTPSAAGAQEDAPPPPAGPPSLFFETVDVDVVNVEVFVTDRKGNAVTGLAQDDFRLTVDGAEVPITNFYSEVLGRPVQDAAGVSVDPQEGSFDEAPPDQRLHLIVYVDNDNVRPAVRKRVFQSLREFLDTSLAPEDYVTVASSRKSVFTHSDFLKDRRTLNFILDDIEKNSGSDLSGELEARQIVSELSREGATATVRGDRFADPTNFNRTENERGLLIRIQAYAAAEYHESLQNLDALGGFLDSMSGVPGRKALLHVSSGIPTRPGEGLYLAYLDRFFGGTSEGSYYNDVGQYDLTNQFQELAIRANAARLTFYALDADPNHASYLRSAVTEGIAAQGSTSLRAEGAMEENSRQPLESMAHATGGQRLYAGPSLQRQLSSIATDFSTFYSLGFHATGKESKKSHNIKVALAKDTGKGLTVRHRTDFTRVSPEQKMAGATLAALLYNSVDNPLKVSMSHGESQRREDGRLVLPVDLQIPLEHVTLLPNQGVHAARLSLFVTVKNERGEPRPVQKVPFALNIPDEFIERAKGDSARYTLPVVVDPGDQQVAIGIRDEIGANESTLRIELPKSL